MPDGIRQAHHERLNLSRLKDLVKNNLPKEAKCRPE